MVASRQPVLSVLSAPAFRRLAQMPDSLLHQYPFIAITIVFYDSRGRAETPEILLHVQQCVILPRGLSARLCAE